MPEPEKSSKPTEPQVEQANIPAVHHLVRLMKRYDLTAIDFIEGSTQIRLRRRGHESAPVYQAPPTLGPQPSPPSIPAMAPASTAPAAPSPPAGLVIESPMVGTFYSSSSPDAPSFVSVGSTVRSDTTVCIIEAMKVFTDIPAGLSGTIAEMLVKNGQSVEYGQPLFRVTPA